MSTTVHLPAHSWASAHRVLLTVVAIALALAVALTIALVVSRTTTDETIAPGGSVNLTPSEPDFPKSAAAGTSAQNDAATLAEGLLPTRCCLARNVMKKPTGNFDRQARALRPSTPAAGSEAC